VITQILLKSSVLHKVRPSLTKAQITCVVRDRMASEAKVGIQSDKQRIDVPVNVSIKTQIKINKTTYLTGDVTTMFFPGCGHARHRTAHSPSLVFKIPAGSCPLPERLSILR